MLEKNWVSEVQGHTIRVSNTWFSGAKLHIDGECRDTCNKTFALTNMPVLSGRLKHGQNDSPLVEVFMKAVFSVKAKICVDGKHIGGDII